MKTQPSQTLQILQQFNQASLQHDASLLEDLILERLYSCFGLKVTVSMARTVRGVIGEKTPDGVAR